VRPGRVKKVQKVRSGRQSLLCFALVRFALVRFASGAIYTCDFPYDSVYHLLPKVWVSSKLIFDFFLAEMYKQPIAMAKGSITLAF
jgi:hypothetical protein